MAPVSAARGVVAVRHVLGEAVATLHLNAGAANALTDPEPVSVGI